MRIASLGSGSRGNGTLVEGPEGCVLVDCGFSVRETERRLAGLGTGAGELAAILVTHEHSDHLSGVLPLAREYGLPVFMTAGTARAAQPNSRDSVHLIGSGERVGIAGFQVEAVAVPHDAREPVQYIFAAAALRFGVLTDLGSVTPHVVDRDRDLLAAGPYPAMLKRRVGGAWGHLSNCQTAQLLQMLGDGPLRTLVVGHVSQQNNSPAHVQAALAAVTAQLDHTYYADQYTGLGWLSLT